jgi:hypothetical protein
MKTQRFIFSPENTEGHQPADLALMLVMFDTPIQALFNVLV